MIKKFTCPKCKLHNFKKCKISLKYLCKYCYEYYDIEDIIYKEAKNGSKRK